MGILATARRTPNRMALSALAALLGMTLTGLAGTDASASAAPADAGALCAAVAAGHAACFAIRGSGTGFTPDDLGSAYQVPSNGGAGETVAVIDAYDDPAAESDLAVYRARFGLDACTGPNGCFLKVDQRGTTTYSTADAGWAGQISMDLDVVSAMAPRAHLLLVEADNNSDDNLAAAVDEAVALGAKVVSVSYGSSYTATPGSGEDPYEVTDLDRHYNHPGVVIVAGSGSSGFGVTYPAASQFVTGVGGTSLSRTAGGNWTQTAWSGTGAGCSLYEAKPAWQEDTGCSMRIVGDVSAVADPMTGVAVYDSYSSTGWASFGGSAAPIIAGLYADGGAPAPGTYPTSYAYAQANQLTDVTTGSDGACSPAYYCTGGPGYDGPTGLGTPAGLAGFTANAVGEITGTVSDAATHAPVGGATITAGGETATTRPDGTYALVLAAGTYSLTATAPGYSASPPLQVVVGGIGATTSQNVALAESPPPTVTVSGTVTDASGHGWPLYATVSANGVTAFTDPVTGYYSITVPAQGTYALRVSAVYRGYVVVTRPVSVGTTNQIDNAGLPVDAASCSAPGYARSRNTCYAVTGGLLVGTVMDSSTSAPLNVPW